MKENSPTIKEALKEASLRLQNPKEAQILLTHHLKCDRIHLMLHENDLLGDAENYFALIKRREANEPIEYITNEVSFYAQTFYIAPGALIPRPETELLIDKAKEIIEKEEIRSIAEIGTGSGIISIVLAQHFPKLKITASDISTDALKIARTNISKFGLEDRINLHHTSLLDGINEKFDMIISNPPYIADGFVLEKPLYYEPSNALFGGKEGDELLKEIIDLAIEKEVPYLLCEMGYDQKAPLSAYFSQKGVQKVEFYQDYSGFDRGFVANIKELSSKPKM